MVKKVIGGYMSVEEAAAEIEHLLTDGYTSSDLVVVTKSANKGALESLTVANVDPVADKKGLLKDIPISSITGMKPILLPHMNWIKIQLNTTTKPLKTADMSFWSKKKQ
ncbi:hypothetical protein QNK01_01330 [Desemzia incerta]|uniref:hypothetical protein n=1 Tax=Desemzia incerta TaxID=82801 RepID=UPI0024C391B6|nr:hypothetical protein [Desemzia incerta]WHZ32311.1 hypothetical protein QNK01_01330 [Desemzia incerta]